MSRAFNKGYEDATNTYDALRPEDWHSEAHAQGWIYGLECLIDNYAETTPDRITSQAYLDASIKRMEKAIEDTEKVIDQVIGSKDHKNQIQKMAIEIERLKQQLDAYEN